MPTTTIIILAIMAVLLPWTAYQLLKDVVRKLGARSAVRSKSDELRDNIEAEREKDRVKMGSMFASTSLTDKSDKKPDGE